MPYSSLLQPAIPKSAAPRSSTPVAVHCCPVPSQETLKQFCLSLYGKFGSQGAQGLFEPSEPVCQVWGLILNEISPLLSSCWGFSFALGCGVSPQICSSTAQPLLQHLSSCWGFSALECGIAPHSCSSTMQPLLQILTDK